MADYFANEHMSVEPILVAPSELTWPMSQRGNPLHLDAESRATLLQWVREHTTPQRVVLRSRILLLLGDGLSGREVARRMNVARHTVDLWRLRFREGGCVALLRDKPGRGRRRSARPA
jgi:transposase